MPAPATQLTSPILQGIRVLDLSRVLSGPFAGMMLGDLGAEVWKVEPRSGDNSRELAPPYINGESAYYLSVNRNKLGLCLDFRNAEAPDVLRRLAAKADVVLENFLPQVKKELGIDYETVSVDNPGVVYCSISGFGQDGPRSGQPGFDNIFQGMAGFMAVTGDPGRPMKAGERIGDVIAGLNAAYAVMAALFARQRTGKGQAVSLGLVDCLLAAQAPMVSYFLATGEQPPKTGNGSLFSVPTETFETADKPINLCVFVDKHWRVLCDALGLDAEFTKAEYATNKGRIAAADKIHAAIAAVLRTNTLAHWMDVFAKAKIPAGPVYGYAEVFADPQILHNGMVQELCHPETGKYKSLASPLHFSGCPEVAHSAAPRLGEHSRRILGLAGFSSDEIAALLAKNIVYDSVSSI